MELVQGLSLWSFPARMLPGVYVGTNTGPARTPRFDLVIYVITGHIRTLHFLANNFVQPNRRQLSSARFDSGVENRLDARSLPCRVGSIYHLTLHKMFRSIFHITIHKIFGTMVITRWASFLSDLSVGKFSPVSSLKKWANKIADSACFLDWFQYRGLE